MVECRYWAVDGATDIRTGNWLSPNRHYYWARILSPTNGVYLVFNIPPADYARHWELEGPHGPK